MRRLSLFVLALASGALACAGAEARPLHHRHHAHVSHVRHFAQYPADREILVKKRSFLDPGNVVPVGSENHYMDESTIYDHAPGGTYRRSPWDNEVLPGPFDLPGFLPYAPW